MSVNYIVRGLDRVFRRVFLQKLHAIGDVEQPPLTPRALRIYLRGAFLKYKSMDDNQ